MNKPPDLIDFRIRKKRDGSRLGCLLAYLDNDPDGKSKVEEAISAFWLPFAYQASKGEEVQHLARKAIAALEAQIQILRESFGIAATPMQSWGTVAHPAPTSEDSNPPALPEDCYLFDDE